MEKNKENFGQKQELEPNLKNAFAAATRAFKKTIPTIIGVILLISLTNSLITKEMYAKVFWGSFLDSIIGAIIGSISAGTPFTSYIIGGELLKQGISLTAVTAFIVAWVTVGIIQLPAESIMLGKKFAITRNIISFIFAIIVAIISVLIFVGIGGSL